MQKSGLPILNSRALAAFLLLFSLAASVAPQGAASQQRGSDVRPRRVNSSTKQQTYAGRDSSSAQNSAQQKPAPTPNPTPDYNQDEPPPPPPRPRLQTSPGAAAATPTPTPDGQPQEVEEDETIRVNVQEVKHSVRVVDRYNRPVQDVRKEDFRVYDGGILQDLLYVETREVPISYGVVVDNSGSLRGQITQVIDATKSIINSNKEDDEAFVVRFVSSQEIKILQDWTARKQDLIDAVDDMFVEGGQTAIIDAVYLAAEHTATRKRGNDLEDKRRRALILVTDGEDRSSFYEKEQLFESLRENDVQIYVIGFVNELEKGGGIIRKSRREKAMDLLENISKQTGGRVFYPKSLSELPGIAEEITKDMRTQYVVGYVPSNPARPGEFRPIRIQIADAPGREKRIAITRAGYTPQRASQDSQTQSGPAQRMRPASNRRP